MVIAPPTRKHLDPLLNYGFDGFFSPWLTEVGCTTPMSLIIVDPFQQEKPRKWNGKKIGQRSDRHTDSIWLQSTWHSDGWWFQTWILFSISYMGIILPNWRTPSFFRGVGIPPTSSDGLRSSNPWCQWGPPGACRRSWAKCRTDFIVPGRFIKSLSWLMSN